MSTKIYTGFRVNTGSLAANLAKLDELVEPIQGLVDKKNSALTLRLAWESVDSLYYRLKSGHPLSDLHREADTWGTLDACFQQVRKRQMTCRGGDTRDAAHDCDVSLFLRVHQPSQTLLGYIQEERVGVYEYLLQQAGIEDYAYWNNTDEPDHLSEAEWNARRDAWTEVLDAPQACLTMTWQPFLPTVSDEDLAGIPSHEDRALRIARNIVTNAALERLMTEAEKNALHERASFSGVMRASRQADKLLNDPTSDLHREMLNEQQRLKGILLPAITRELLQRRVSKLPGLETEDWPKLLAASPQDAKID